MYFRDFDLAEDWSRLFAELMLDNWVEGPVDGITISRQLLGFDQRTFPMVAAKHGLWGENYWSTGKLEAFLDLEWTGEKLVDSKTGEDRQWHYYTLEYHPEKTDWMQDITHTWINKRDIELDVKYQSFQCCILLELVLGLCPWLREPLRSIGPMKPYFALLDTGCTIEELLAQGLISGRLTKQ